MNKIATIIILSVIFFCCSDKKENIKVPVQQNDFTLVYSPEGDTFPGPSTVELEAGKYYETWVPNDHTLIQDEEGKWHIFGITHPITSTQNVHEGEFLSFHAKQGNGGFLVEKGFLDLPKVLAPSERPGELLQFYAPYAVKKDGMYYMVYSPSPIRLAVSKDLVNWEPKGVLFKDVKGSRDPNIFIYKGKYHIIYCTERKVGLRTSEDLISWSEPTVIYESKDFDPESPSIIVKDGGFYLFMCAWDGIWDKKEVQGAYQHKTYVFYSTDVEDFFNREPIAMLNAHAPEIFMHEDQWYISSVEWPKRGVSIDKLDWK